MRLSNFHFGRLAALSGFLTSAAVGCVLTVGDGGKAAGGESCPDANSFLNNGECFCNVGYDWCNENDNSDLTCCENPTSGNTNGNTNSNTGNNNTDATNGTTESVPTSGASETTTDVPTSGTTGDPLECTVDTAPPASCNPDTEPFLCIQASNPACNTEGSKFYVCTGGKWVENPNGPDENCKADGYDFGVGCEDDGTKIVFDCGVGPGTDCQTGEAPTCNGETKYQECYHGKLTETDCTAYCMEVGDNMMVTYDYGYCGEQRDEIACICCDEGDEGCPINTDTTGSDTTTGGDTTGGDTTTGG